MLARLSLSTKGCVSIVRCCLADICISQISSPICYIYCALVLLCGSVFFWRNVDRNSPLDPECALYSACHIFGCQILYLYSNFFVPSDNITCITIMYASLYISVTFPHNVHTLPIVLEDLAMPTLVTLPFCLFVCFERVCRGCADKARVPVLQFHSWD